MSDKQCGFGGCVRAVDFEGEGAAMCAGHWVPVWRTLLDGAQERLRESMQAIEDEKARIAAARRALNIAKESHDLTRIRTVNRQTGAVTEVVLVDG